MPGFYRIVVANKVITSGNPNAPATTPFEIPRTTLLNLNGQTAGIGFTPISAVTGLSGPIPKLVHLHVLVSITALGGGVNCSVDFTILGQINGDTIRATRLVADTITQDVNGWIAVDPNVAGQIQYSTTTGGNPTYSIFIERIGSSS